MAKEPRFLVIDGYPRAGREVLVAAGASVASDLYARMLQRCAPQGAACDVFFVADEGAEPPAPLSSYDGIAWTGSNLSVNDQTPQVLRQIELARRVSEAGIPSFGSCWAAQIAAVLTGGRVQPNPNGREAGLARKIQLTAEGRAHPLYEGKPAVFDGFTNHDDEITHLGPRGLVLSRNRWTPVQAVSTSLHGTPFWAVQYHPEYDLHELARLTVCRIPILTRQGLFRDEAAALRYVELLECLHQDPTRKDVAWLLGIDADVLDPDLRQLEVRNWIRHVVLPRVGR